MDGRISELFKNASVHKYRLLVAMVGLDLQKQVMMVHHILCKNITRGSSVLWCHCKESTTPAVLRKTAKRAEKRLKKGDSEITKENSFETFLLTTKIKFCSFSDTTSILGSTYAMCVIQDYSFLTPNVLCQVVETVVGGGCILLLLEGIDTLRKLFDLKMDFHSKLKTFSCKKLRPLYNKRFVHSLSWCKSSLLVDKYLVPMEEIELKTNIGANRENLRKLEEGETELNSLVDSLKDGDEPLPQLVGLCKTVDQAKALLKVIEVLSEKSGQATVCITSGRGRGKSSLLGLGVAAAINFGISNIFVVSPVPGNLVSFFEFLLKGFDALGYKESEDYAIYQSNTGEFKGFIIKIALFVKHRQIVQYVSPMDFYQVSQAELVIIDEAASIPLPQVKGMIGPYNVLMASTVSGYEGSGRSLSLKLLQELRKQSVIQGMSKSDRDQLCLSNCRPLFELSLQKSIRYCPDDPVEKWLHRLFCLDATSQCPSIDHCPPPDMCDLYYVNKSMLLSGHKATESFLADAISLLVASHYRNSPDDFLTLSDASSHELFVLLPPRSTTDDGKLPSVLCVVQVCVEGGIPEQVSSPILSRGERPAGDMISWSLATNFLDAKLTELNGIRIVRVATHPDYQSMGYGSRTIKLLIDFYKGRFVNLDRKIATVVEEVEHSKVGPIVSHPPSVPLLNKLEEVERPCNVDYVGVSFSLTQPLFNFWGQLDFKPVNMSPCKNKITGENNCLLVHLLDNEFPGCLANAIGNFYESFVILLGSKLRDLHPTLSYSIARSCKISSDIEKVVWSDVAPLVSGHDLQRLQSYSKNMSDRHLIMDLFTPLARLYFGNYLQEVHLSKTQGSVLIGIGLQHLSIEEVSTYLSLPIASCLGQLNRMVKRLLGALKTIQEEEVAKRLPSSIIEMEKFDPVKVSLDADLAQAAVDFRLKTRNVTENFSENVLRSGSDSEDESKGGTYLESEGDESIASINSRMTKNRLKTKLSHSSCKSISKGNKRKR